MEYEKGANQYGRYTYYNKNCRSTLKHNGSYWTFYDEDGFMFMYYQSSPSCPESITGTWREWYEGGNEWHDDPGNIRCETQFQQCSSTSVNYRERKEVGNEYSEPEHEVSFSWKIDPWFILWNGLENGEYYESPMFTTEEGYSQGSHFCF